MNVWLALRMALGVGVSLFVTTCLVVLVDEYRRDGQMGAK